MIVRTLIRMALFWVPGVAATLGLQLGRSRIPADSPPQMTMLGDERSLGWMLGGGVLGLVLVVVCCLVPRGRWRAGLVWLPTAVVLFMMLAWILREQPVPSSVAGPLVMLLAPLIASLLVEWYRASVQRMGRAGTRPGGAPARR